MARKEERAARRGSMRDKVKTRAEDNKYTGGGGYIRPPDGVSFLSIEKGTVNLDIVPFEIKEDMTIPDTAAKDMDLEAGDLWYQRTLFIHHGIGADQKSYLCPRTIKKACPICEERARLMKDPGAEKKLIDQLKPQHKDLFNVDCGKEGIKLFEFSYANFRKKLEEEIREGKDEWAGFADLEEGYTVSARFSEETFAGRKYLEVSRIDFEPRDDYDDNILEDVVDLNECLNVLPYDKLQAIFLELDGEDGGDKEKEEKPAQRGRREKAKEEPEERPRRGRREEPEEAPKEERPARRGRREEPAEEPEEKPRRGRREEPAEDDLPPVEEPPVRRGRREEPEPEEKPAKRAPREEPKKEAKGGDCPHGGTWAKDCDTLDSCFECKVWEACRDAADGL
jgi:hypothetical protein